MRKQRPNIRSRNHSRRAENAPKEKRETPINDDPNEGIRRAKSGVLASVGEIVGAIELKAKAGSCAHAKLLFEFAGIEFGPEEKAEEESLSGILLRRLDDMQRSWREQYGAEFPPYGEAAGRKVE